MKIVDGYLKFAIYHTAVFRCEACAAYLRERERLSQPANPAGWDPVQGGVLAPPKTVTPSIHPRGRQAKHRSHLR